jgi:hypothetical protein
VIGKNLDRPLNAADWFNYYSFDVMGDLAFGESFNMLIDGKDAYILKKLHADMKSIGLFSHLTWLFPFFKRVPILNSEYLKFWEFVGERVAQRIKVSNIILLANRNLYCGIEPPGTSRRVFLASQSF